MNAVYRMYGSNYRTNEYNQRRGTPKNCRAYYRRVVTDA